MKLIYIVQVLRMESGSWQLLGIPNKTLTKLIMTGKYMSRRTPLSYWAKRIVAWGEKGIKHLEERT
jgi:hypothetical protein